MADRSSRPHSMPTKTPAAMVRRIVKARWRRRLGPVQIAGELGIAASTVHAVLVRCRINRLARIDRVTGEPIRRYEHDYAGSMIHVDVTKFGNIPEGGGHKFLSRQQSKANARAQACRTGERGREYRPRIGTAFVHTVLDDHSRVAYAEICSDEKAATAIGVLQRAVAWFADRGVTVERVLSDNGAAYRSYALCLARCLHSTGHPAQKNPTLPAADEREDRTLPPHPRRRLGPRPLLRLRKLPPRRPTQLAALPQSPQAPLRHRNHTHQQTQQPPRTPHLDR